MKSYSDEIQIHFLFLSFYLGIYRYNTDGMYDYDMPWFMTIWKWQQIKYLRISTLHVKERENTLWKFKSVGKWL